MAALCGNPQERSSLPMGTPGTTPGAQNGPSVELGGDESVAMNCAILTPWPPCVLRNTPRKRSRQEEPANPRRGVEEPPSPGWGAEESASPGWGAEEPASPGRGAKELASPKWGAEASWQAPGGVQRSRQAPGGVHRVIQYILYGLYWLNTLTRRRGEISRRGRGRTP